MALLALDVAAEKADPRIRTFVPPVRVMWTSQGSVSSMVANAESLIAPHHGQAPEIRWHERHGCVVSNGGERASPLLDFGRNYWGAMLDMGATSFREDFNVAWTNNAFRIDEMPVPGKKDIHGDCGEFCYKGFRHSLCHAWRAGPAAWCINHVLGIRPVGVGCRNIEVKPFLGDLAWAEGSMALPGGKSIFVLVEKGDDGAMVTKVDAPPDIRIIR